MAREVQVRQAQLLTPQIAEVQPSRAGEILANALGNTVATVSNAIREQSEKNYRLRLDGELKKELSRIERENLGNPETMQKALEDYHKDVMETVPYKRMRSEVNNVINENSIPILNRAFKAKRDQVDAETTEQLILNIDSVKNDIFNTSTELFSGNESASIAALKIQQGIGDISRMLDATKSDGTPIFTAKERASKLLSTRDAMFQTAAKTWINQQPNKVEAYQRWKDGEVTVAFPDENGEIEQFNIRETIPAEVRTKIDNDFISSVKDELSFEAAMAAKEAREFEDNSNRLASLITVQQQQGVNTLELVDALKSQFEPDTYINLRKLSIQNNPINNEAVYGDLLRRVYAGEDIIAAANDARFNRKEIDNKSYEDLIRISKSGSGGGTEAPVDSGRKFLVENLGGLSQLLSITASSTIANAKRDYDDSVVQFREENGRLPSREESLSIADQVLPRYQLIELDKQFETMPKPMFMTVQEKASGSRQIDSTKMEEIIDRTNKAFMQKHNNDISAVADDPEYQKEMKYINSYVKLVDSREKMGVGK